MEILENFFFIGELIQAIDILSELKSLKIHSLSLDQPRELSEDEVDILLSTEYSSKITNVCLSEMIKIQEVYFLMQLCPYMNYFKLDCIKNMNIESFLRDIINKITSERNQYLRLLCVKVPDADDKMIKKLDEIINSEK